MSILAMKKINICAMKKDRVRLLETLQNFGALEIDDEIFKDLDMSRLSDSDEKIAFERKATMLENVLDVLENYNPEKKGLLSSLEGKELIGKETFQGIVKKEDDIMNKAQEILDGQKKIIENKVSIDKNKVSIEYLSPWLDLDIPFEFTHTEKTAFLIGTIINVESLEEIYDNIGTHLVDLSEVEVQIIHKDKNQTCVVAVCLKEYEESVENGLHTLGFARVSNAFTGIPRQIKEEYLKENNMLEAMTEETKRTIEKLNEEKAKFKVLSDYYRMMAKKVEAMSKLPQSESTFFLNGYIPAKYGKKFLKKIEKDFELSVDMYDPDNEDEVPILLENGSVGSAVEGIVESYGLPKKGEIDPSKIMGMFYIFLFGLMLSDAAYGLIIFLTCFFIIKKYDRMEKSMKKSIKMFMYCGISTMIWGILFGGYFGDVISIASETFLGTQIDIKPLWFTPIDDPMKLLIYCMLFGIIHLFTGLAMKGYMCIKNKRYMDFVCDVILWYMILIGLIIMFLPTDLFFSLSQMKISFPGFINTLAKIMAIGGAIGILLLAGRGRKNPGLRFALGAYDLYNITGWLSDLLSYSRLLALGLATGVIASVVNQIGAMGGNSVIGIILFLIVFVIGHVFNMAINMLGAYVHTNRLQYVEFFSKFYEGGGKAFNPLKSNTKYIEIGEEIE